MDDPSQNAAPVHWRRRPKGKPILPELAARQGDITAQAFTILGREQAIAFLNTENAVLGGRPLAIATDTEDGHVRVKAELNRMREPQTDHP
jgi:antitoxin Xre/MbcA/ParS-like protein